MCVGGGSSATMRTSYWCYIFNELKIRIQHNTHTQTEEKKIKPNKNLPHTDISNLQFYSHIYKRRKVNQQRKYAEKREIEADDIQEDTPNDFLHASLN